MDTNKYDLEKRLEKIGISDYDVRMNLDNGDLVIRTEQNEKTTDIEKTTDNNETIKDVELKPVEKARLNAVYSSLIEKEEEDREVNEIHQLQMQMEDEKKKTDNLK